MGGCGSRCAENITLPCIAQLLRQSRLEAPGVLLTVEQCALPQQLEQLCAGLIDVGLIVSASEQPAGDRNDIDALPLSRDRIVVAMHLDHPLASKPVVASLEGGIGPFFLVGTRAGDVGSLEGLIERCNGRPEELELVDSVGLLLTRVALGDGLGLMSAQQAETVARGDIVFRPLEPSRARFTTYLLTPRVDRSGLVTRFTERARRFHLRRPAPSHQQRGVQAFASHPCAPLACILAAIGRFEKTLLGGAGEPAALGLRHDLRIRRRAGCGESKLSVMEDIGNAVMNRSCLCTLITPRQLSHWMLARGA